MKSNFTLALAAAVALTASAEGRQQMATGKVVVPETNYISAVKLTKKTTAPARVRALTNFVGEYEWSRYDMLDYHKTLTSTLEFTLTDASTGEFKISGFPGNYSVTAFIDPEAGTLKIHNLQDLGMDYLGDSNYFYLKETVGASYSDGATDADWTVGTINGKVITFPQDDVWAIGNYPSDWSFWIVTNENKLTFLGDIEEEEEEEPGEPLEGVDAIAGEYEYSYYGLLSGNSGAQTGALTISVTNAATGEVAISGWPQSYVVKGKFDPQAGTLTIANKQNLGADSYGDDNYFYVKGVDEEGNLLSGASDVEATVGTFADYTVTFPTLDVWVIGDFNNEALGYWWLSYRNVFNGEDPNNDPNEGWEDFCTADFEDGWILPAYTMGGEPILPSDMPWTVNVQKSTSDENLYRLDNPYTAEGCPIPSTATKTGGYIVFSIEDPEFVIVMPGIFSGALTGVNKICCVNEAGFYTGQGYTKEQIIAGLDDFQSSTYNDDTRVVNIPNCGFNFTSNGGVYYTWTDSENNSLAANMQAKITLSRSTSAVTNVEVDDQNAPVVYYNLQGVRVENPANGVFIRVQGNKAVKVAK